MAKPTSPIFGIGLVADVFVFNVELLKHMSS